MALLNSKYIKYDMTTQEYYINIDCVINNTAYSSADLLGRKIDNNVLKMISHSVYRVIYDYRKGVNKYAHKKYMRKKIYNNANEEVSALMSAMLEATKGAVESGMDLNAYTNEPTVNMPYTVMDELKSADLLDATDKLDYGLDIVYTDGDELIATQATV